MYCLIVKSIKKKRNQVTYLVASVFNAFYAFYVISFYWTLSFKSILMSLLKYRCHISRILYQGQFPDRIVFTFKRGWSRKSDQIFFVMISIVFAFTFTLSIFRCCLYQTICNEMTYCTHYKIEQETTLL